MEGRACGMVWSCVVLCCSFVVCCGRNARLFDVSAKKESKAKRHGEESVWRGQMEKVCFFDVVLHHPKGRV